MSQANFTVFERSEFSEFAIALIFCKIKTPPIPVSDVLPLFWFFMVQYISIFVLIIAYISNF